MFPFYPSNYSGKYTLVKSTRIPTHTNTIQGSYHFTWLFFRNQFLNMVTPLCPALLGISTSTLVKTLIPSRCSKKQLEIFFQKKKWTCNSDSTSFSAQATNWVTCRQFTNFSFDGTSSIALKYIYNVWCSILTFLSKSSLFPSWCTQPAPLQSAVCSTVEAKVPFGQGAGHSFSHAGQPCHALEPQLRAWDY